MYILTLVQKNANGETSSLAIVYPTKNEAFERLYYEMYYAHNQNLPYTLCSVMDMYGMVHKVENFINENPEEGELA